MRLNCRMALLIRAPRSMVSTTSVSVPRAMSLPASLIDHNIAGAP